MSAEKEAYEHFMRQSSQHRETLTKVRGEYLKQVARLQEQIKDIDRQLKDIDDHCEQATAMLKRLE